MRPPEELKLIFLGCEPPEADDFEPSERSYPGNKAHLLSFLERVVRAKSASLTTFADLFAGTGTVAAHFAASGARVVANDLRYSSYVANCAFLLSHGGNVDRGKLREIVTYLSRLPGRQGWLARRGESLLGPVAAKLQACRAAIAELRAGGRLTEQEERVLLCSLVHAVDRASELRKDHLPLRLPKLADYRTNSVFNQDARQLAREVEADAVYLDPPLGRELEAERLSFLEDVARGGVGVTGDRGVKAPLPPSLGPLAEWADPVRAGRALSDIIGRVRTRHLFLSYSSEGVIPNRAVWELLKTRGRPECFEFERAGATPGGRVVDRLFYCQCEPQPPQG